MSFWYAHLYSFGFSRDGLSNVSARIETLEGLYVFRVKNQVPLRLSVYQKVPVLLSIMCVIHPKILIFDQVSLSENRNRINANLTKDG